MNEKISYLKTRTLEHLSGIEKEHLKEIEIFKERVENDTKLLKDVIEIFKDIQKDGFLNASTKPSAGIKKIDNIYNQYDFIDLSDEDELSRDFTPVEIYLHKPTIDRPIYRSGRMLNQSYLSSLPVYITLRFNIVTLTDGDDSPTGRLDYDELRFGALNGNLYRSVVSQYQNNGDYVQEYSTIGEWVNIDDKQLVDEIASCIERPNKIYNGYKHELIEK